jgi:hypothetical protein
VGPHDSDRQTEDVARVVSRYLAAHPGASDTLEGIAGWWLMRQRVDDACDVVAAALELLTARGVVETRTTGNGVTLFRSARASGRS